jgi:membrane-bound lytic murein transglycosylase D
MRVIFIAIWTLIVLGCPSSYATPPKATPKIPDWTVTPKTLVPDVQFWVDVYSKYDNNTVVLHDTEYLGVIYGTLDLHDLSCLDECAESVKKARQDRLKEAKEKIRQLLLTLAENPPDAALTPEAKRIKAVWRKWTSGNVFEEAASDKRLRGQTGQKTRFGLGLTFAEHYMPKFEVIFKNEGLPVELTRLVMVESMFSMKAISHAGASGVWQFMPGTARRYSLRITPAIDERNDPILATYAATRMLRADYEVLGSWPLAINAYNAGRGHLQRATSALGTRDIVKIIRQHRQGTYGFASRNYYPEFLAACVVYDKRNEYFPSMKHLPPLAYKTISITTPTPLADIMRRERTSIDALELLNPGLQDAVLVGRIPVPSGVEIRVPVRR